MDLAHRHRQSVRQHDRDVALAWEIAALSRQERLPPLKTLLSRKPVPRQTAAEMKSLLMAHFKPLEA